MMKEVFGSATTRVKSAVGSGGGHYGKLRFFLPGVLLISLIVVCWAATGLAADPAAFDPAVNYTAGTSPRGVTQADFDADGFIDLAVANRDSKNVSIMLGNGDGTFGAAANFAVLGSYPSAVVAGDFNADGNIDLAVTHQFPDAVSILLGNGDGTFGGATDFPAGTYSSALATADFNGDSNTDLVVANNNSNNISVLVAYGDGTFSAAAANYAVGTNPRGVATGDFDGDGKIDIATANASSNNVSILLGNGHAGFSAPVNYPVVGGSNLRSIATGDFNLDGKTDLVVVSKTATNNISTLMGNGDGTFGAAVNYTGGSTPEGPLSVISGDLNADGKPDIAVANYTSGNVSVLLNATPFPCTVGKPALSLAAPVASWGSYANYTAHVLSVTWTVTNTGATDAFSVAITTSSSPNALVTTVPGWAAIGDIPAGDSGSTVIQYQLPGNSPTGFGFHVINTASANDCADNGYTYP